MFDGKTFLPVTGTPIRKMACMMRPFADAEPVPLAVAILNAKSLTRFICCAACTCPTLRADEGRRAGVRNVDDEFPHVPCVGGTPLGAQAAVQTHVLVLHHDATGLLEGARDEQCLRQFGGR